MDQSRGVSEEERGHIFSHQSIHKQAYVRPRRGGCEKRCHVTAVVTFTLLI